VCSPAAIKAANVMQTKPAYLGAFPGCTTSFVCESVRVCV
jgi:hypothetical protein